MTDTACSTCHDIAAVLLGGQCRACATRRILCDVCGLAVVTVLPDHRGEVICTACALRCLGRAADGAPCVLEPHHPAPCASLRPLPPGAPEAVQQVTAECRAEGVPAGLLAEPAPQRAPGELGSVPASIEDAIDAFQRSVDHGDGGGAGRTRRALRAAIARELAAVEERVREAVRVECSTCGDHHLEGCPECGVDADPRAPLLDVDLTLQQLGAAQAQLDVLRRLLATTRAELAEQRERHLEHRQDLYEALSERDAWRARAETAERELAALRPAPAPERPQVAPFCFGCGEEHGAACTCTRAGSQ